MTSALGEKGKTMSDYIKREDAMKALADEYDECEFKKYAEGLFKDIPPADVAPVVRCADCKWWTKQEASCQGRCALFGIYPTGAWYCANGAKMDEGESDGTDNC